MPHDLLDWIFYALLVASFTCSAVGFLSSHPGWYVLAVFLAVGAFADATMMATIAPPDGVT